MSKIIAGLPRSAGDDAVRDRVGFVETGFGLTGVLGPCFELSGFVGAAFVIAGSTAATGAAF